MAEQPADRRQTLAEGQGAGGVGEEEALAEAKSMYEALVEVKPKVRMCVMVKVITKEPDWETYIKDFIVEADG